MKQKLEKILGWMLITKEDIEMGCGFREGWYLAQDGKTAYSPEIIDEIISLFLDSLPDEIDEADIDGIPQTLPDYYNQAIQDIKSKWSEE